MLGERYYMPQPVTHYLSAMAAMKNMRDEARGRDFKTHLLQRQKNRPALRHRGSRPLIYPFAVFSVGYF